jgi:hypothetical protein
MAEESTNNNSTPLLWHVDPLVGHNSEIRNYTTVVRDNLNNVRRAASRYFRNKKGNI